MLLDTARPRYKENTTCLGMRGRDAARKSTPKVNTLQIFTIDVQRSSLSCITTRVRIVRTSAKRWDELAKEDHTYHLSPEEKRKYKGQRYLTLNKTGKNGPMKLRSDTLRIKRTN